MRTPSALTSPMALSLSILTAVLLAAGALVTSTGSGLSVPDWPLSFGQFFPPMVGGVLFEHGHRLIAGSVGVLTILFATWLAFAERRRWVRRIAYAAVACVVLQATLGGLTVLLKLPTVVSVAHACLAQIFFTLTVVLAIVTRPSWEEPARPLEEEPGVSISLPALTTALSALFFIQLTLGAFMRHMGAGLAIPDFPTVYGGWFPTNPSLPVLIHFAHRLGAYSLIALFVWVTVRLSRRHGSQLGLIALAGVLAVLLSTQVMLGAMVIWMRRPVPMTTAHLVVGALCLATSVALALHVRRAARERTAPRARAIPFRGKRQVLA